MSVSNKYIVGTIWTLLDLVFNKAIYFISTIILARLLSPEDFGLIGLIMIFFTIGTTLVESGLSVSIIRSKVLNDIESSTIFYLNLSISFLAYFFIFFLAPFVADFYDQQILEPLIRVYCIGFIIASIRLIPQAMLVRSMNFRRITLLNIPGNIVGLATGIWMAVNGYKVWSIVGLFLSTQVISSLIYLLFSSWKPKMIFSFTSIKEHWTFGYKLMLSAQLNTIFDNTYNILIGKFYSVQSLGYYERAYTLNNYPISIITLLVSKVSFPIFSNISGDKVKMFSVYRKISLIAFYFISPLMLGALVLAKPIFLIFLGKQWLEAVPFFQILCLGYILYPIHSLNINLLTVYGRSDLFLKLELLKKIFLVIFILIGFYFGIIGLMWSGVFSSVVSFFLNSYYSGELISYNSKLQLKDLFPTLLLSILMAISIYIILIQLEGFDYLFQLFISGSFGLIIFFILSFLTKNEAFIMIFTYLKTKVISRFKLY